jgi:hypothetical protein
VGSQKTTEYGTFATYTGSLIHLSRLREVNEPLFAASVPMTKEADTRVLPAHVENGGDKSGTT